MGVARVNCGLNVVSDIAAPRRLETTNPLGSVRAEGVTHGESLVERGGQGRRRLDADGGVAAGPRPMQPVADGPAPGWRLPRGSAAMGDGVRRSNIPRIASHGFRQWTDQNQNPAAKNSRRNGFREQ